MDQDRVSRRKKNKARKVRKSKFNSALGHLCLLSNILSLGNDSATYGSYAIDVQLPGVDAKKSYRSLSKLEKQPRGPVHGKKAH